MLRKLKIYLDTSVPNAYVDSRNPLRQLATQDFWARLDEYQVFISDIVVEEIEATGDETKRNQLLGLVESFEKLSSEGDEIRTLAEEYVGKGIIPLRHIEDAAHIAVATVHSLDALVSWNFEHIVKLKTKRGVNAINAFLGYGQLELVEPSML